MTERTIAHMARELAGQFYDMVRSAESSGERVQVERRGRILLNIEPKAFAKSFPTVRDYLNGTRHGKMQRRPDGSVFHVDDGSVAHITPGWAHWYDLARQMLVDILNNEGTHANVKDGIAAALIEDRQKQLKQEAAGVRSPKIPQRKALPN